MWVARLFQFYDRAESGHLDKEERADNVRALLGAAFSLRRLQLLCSGKARYSSKLTGESLLSALGPVLASLMVIALLRSPWLDGLWKWRRQRRPAPPAADGTTRGTLLTMMRLMPSCDFKVERPDGKAVVWYADKSRLAAESLKDQK
eukprot:Skav223425  [mRNA]  locus=scaffold350:417568:431710:+ [translate_table: standard]